MLIVAIFSWLPFDQAHADGRGGHGFFEMLFGSPDSRGKLNDRGSDRSKEVRCDDYDGVMGQVNGFFCHMEKDLGLTGIGSKTKVFGSFTVHAEISPVATVIFGGVSYNYAYEAKVWVCQSGCTNPANFARAYYLAFSSSPDGTINKGFVLNSPGVFEGDAGSGMLIHYDLGANTTTRFVRTKALFIHSSRTFRMDAYGEKTATTLKLNVVGNDGTNGFRYALSTTPDFATKYFNMYFEQTAASGAGTAALDASGTGAIATSAGLCTQGTESGSALSPMAVSSSNCSALTFNPFANTSATVSSYTAAGILASDASNAWNGMAANPAAI